MLTRKHGCTKIETIDNRSEQISISATNKQQFKLDK